MAKPELRDHRKFLKLKRLLGEPTPHVLGYLECLWHRGYQIGTAFIGDALDVEAAAEYPGEPGRFTKAAHDAGFLDLDEKGNYLIHDLYEHAPKYARMRMQRKGTATKTGTRVPQTGTDVTKTGTRVPQTGTDVTESGTRVPQTGRKRPARTPKPRSEIPDPKAENPKPRTENQSGEVSPDPSPPPAEPGGGAADPDPPADPKPPRPRNELFDAIAEVSGLDPKLNGKEIAVQAAKLKEAGFTPADVAEFGRRFHELCPWAREKGWDRPTPGTITNHVALVRAKPVRRTARSPTQGAALFDRTVDPLRDFVGENP